MVRFLVFPAILFLLLVLPGFASNDFGQCGNYFKTDYHAVDKIHDINGGSFRLDDWTGDGRRDFWNFRPNPNNATADIVIYPASASGYWNWDSPIVLNTSLPSTMNSYNSFFIVKDFNSDGMIDLFMIDSFTIGHIYKNSGSGSLIALASNDSFGNYIGVADVNSDGLLDWIDWVGVPNQGNSIGYRLGMVDGSFAPRVSIVTNTEIIGSSKLIGDFNGDGKPDIAYGSSGSYRVLLNTGGGSFSVGNVISGGQWFNFFDVADFNNDGRTDILAKAVGSQEGMSILYGQANGTLSTVDLPNVNNFRAYYSLADFNGDGRTDIIQYSDRQYSIYSNDGTGGFPRVDHSRSLTSTPGGLIFEDFNGDHKADIWDGGQANAFNEIVVLIKSNVCDPLGETKRANFDGNYFGDLVMWNGSSGLWSSRNGVWGAGVTATTWMNWGTAALGDIPAPGDYDGDGKTDYAVYRNTEGNWYILLSATSTWFVTHFGLPNDVPVPNDFDGGGKTDIAVFRPSDGNWYLLMTETQAFASVHFGTNGDRPVPSDYDGDGKTDVAIFRPSEGNWYSLKSSDLSWSVVHWGISTDIPVPGDFDGDGKSDVAVYRNGVWYILRSSNGAYGIFNWGTTGDIPYVLNREGDIADLVVYRPSQGWWYNLRYSVGFVYVIQFGEPGDSPVNFGEPLN